MAELDPPFAFEWSLPNGRHSRELGGGAFAPLPPDVGEERMTAWSLGDGAGLFEHQHRTRQPISIRATKVASQGILAIRAAPNATAEMHCDGVGRFTEGAGQYSLHLFGKAGSACTVTYAPGQTYSGLAPIITEERLRQMLNGQKVAAPIARFLDGRGENVVVPPRSSPVMHRIIREIRANPYQGGMSALYLQGKVFEMLAEGLASIAEIEEDVKQIFGRDLRRAEMIRDLLIADSSSPPSLDALARQAGLSQRRLNEVFREAFGMTVFEWLVNWRLCKACDLLREGEMSIKEVAFRLGYAHANNFNTAFSRRYGVTPAAFRDQNRTVRLTGCSFS